MASQYDFPLNLPADARPVSLLAEERNAFLRNVYGLVVVGLLCSGVGGYLALTTGAVTLVLHHPYLGMAAFFGLFFAAQAGRHVRGLNLLLLAAFTGLSGVMVAPAVVFAGPAAAANALLTTGGIFIGLTAYVAISKRDFSFLWGFVATAIFALIITMALNIFWLKSSPLNATLAAIGCFLFSAFILFDTSRLLRTETFNEPISFALALYLDIINLFTSLLTLFSRRR